MLKKLANLIVAATDLILTRKQAFYWVILLEQLKYVLEALRSDTVLANI